MACPVCGGSIVGRIGLNQYYCWDCFVEFTIVNGQVQAYKVEADGTLISIINEKDGNSEVANIKDEVIPIG